MMNDLDGEPALGVLDNGVIEDQAPGETQEGDETDQPLPRRLGFEKQGAEGNPERPEGQGKEQEAQRSPLAQGTIIPTQSQPDNPFAELLGAETEGNRSQDKVGTVLPQSRLHAVGASRQENCSNCKTGFGRKAHACSIW